MKIARNQGKVNEKEKNCYELAHLFHENMFEFLNSDSFDFDRDNRLPVNLPLQLEE